MNNNYTGTGTRQWSNKSINFQTGCEHNCLVCYAKDMSIKYKQTTKNNWDNPRIRIKDVKKKISKWNESMVMFPSSHDITPNNIAEAKLVLRKMLKADNEVLIVSKPHYKCIKEICEEFADYKDKILFRFTIGSYNNKVLKFWEPGAPSLNERMKSLKCAFKNRFETSISCEPMMDNKVDKVIDAVKPYVTETLWLGKVNQMWNRLNRNTDMNDELVKKAEQLEKWQSDENILKLYNKYKNDSMMMWKDSIQKVVARSKKVNKK
ncbi:MAG: radical SAM protein [Ignavibacteria bacterium]|nr:radical SAM protein [Ignavibacteria bacterium]MBT8387326.1 radical SAM protein [Ignavibacteria bacterium]